MPAVAKKALKGFSGLQIAPVTQNDLLAYITGELVAVVGAQSMTRDPQTSEWSIDADDGVYDSGTDWTGDNVTITLAELPLAMRATLGGSNYDEVSGEYTFKSIDQAPEFAMTFKCLTTTAGIYRMFRFYSFKVKTITEEYRTKGKETSIQSVSITGQFLERKVDNSVFKAKDTSQESDLTWLDILDNVGEGVDSTAPIVEDVTPESGAIDVAIDTTVVWEFSENIDPVTISSNNFMLLGPTGKVAGALTVQDGSKITFTPTAPLANATQYSAVVTTGVKDLAGNALAAPYVTSFTTVGA